MMHHSFHNHRYPVKGATLLIGVCKIKSEKGWLPLQKDEPFVALRDVHAHS